MGGGLAGPGRQDVGTSSPVFLRFNCFCLSSFGPQFPPLSQKAGATFYLRLSERGEQWGGRSFAPWRPWAHSTPCQQAISPRKLSTPQPCCLPSHPAKAHHHFPHILPHLGHEGLSQRAKPCLLLSFEGIELCPGPGGVRRSWGLCCPPCRVSGSEGPGLCRGCPL